MVIKIKALIDCAVVAGTTVHQFKAGDIAGIEITEAELKFSVDRKDIEVIGQSSAPVKEEVKKEEVKKVEPKKSIKKSGVV